MLLAWYDRDRDFESTQHASECHQDSAVPGYVDYGVHHGATLMVDIKQAASYSSICPWIFRTGKRDRADEVRAGKTDYPRNGSWTAPGVRPAGCLARHDESE
jgi:hypothetical protein